MCFSFNKFKQTSLWNLVVLVCSCWEPHARCSLYLYVQAYSLGSTSDITAELEVGYPGA
jgi:hypothetical protein